MADRLDARCAEESRVRGEDLVGTASRVRRWLVVEQPGPWGRDALTESRLDDQVARALLSRSRRHDVRVLLVRRLGWARRPHHRRAFLAHTDAVGGWLEEIDVDDDGDLLDIDLAAAASSDRPGIGRPGPAVLHLVCTNGRHDACCADRGRPVVRALAAAGTPDVWESSHVGGDRFAANIVCLPVGIYFGRVEPATAARLLADVGRGVLDLDRYRGRSCYPPLVQAAEILARRELGERRLDAIVVDGWERRRDDQVTVTLDHADGRRITAEMVRERGAPEHLTCTANGTARPWQYRAVTLDVR